MLLFTVTRYGIFTIMREGESADDAVEKPIRWIGGSRQDLREFPDEARRDIGYALSFAQLGTKHPSAKTLKGFQGAGVLEIVEDYRGDAFRAVYTVRFAKAVYVLHAFQKKSTTGTKTPRHELDLIDRRLKAAEEDYRLWLKETQNDNT
jgi:phage-related protein